jgi:hypothetical protein
MVVNLLRNELLRHETHRPIRSTIYRPPGGAMSDDVPMKDVEMSTNRLEK